MNLNHDPDTHLLDQIDKLLESGQPSDDAHLNELVATRPILRVAFQTALEERLLARLEQIKQGETPMVNATSYMTIPAPRRNWLPLTLLAALIVVAIAGAMLINGRGKSPTPNEMALAQITTTSTAAPLVRIVVAYQNLPHGYKLPSNEKDMEAIAHYVAWPVDSVPPNALREDVNGLKQLWGKTLLIDVLVNQPITSDALTDGPIPTFNADDVYAASYVGLADRIAVDLPLSALTSDSIMPQVGDSLDITALLPYTGDTLSDGIQVTFMPPNSAKVISNRIVLGATVLHIGSWPQSLPQSNATPTPDIHPTTITVAVPPDNAGLLTWLTGQNVTFRVTRTVGRLDMLPAGAYTILLPLKNVVTDDSIQTGDVVDVYSTCAFVPDATGVNNTVISAKADCSHVVDTQETTGAMVIEDNTTSGTSAGHYQAMVLAVPLELVSRFGKLIDGDMHFKLVKPTETIQPASTFTPIVSPTLASASTPPVPTATPTQRPVSNADLSTFLPPSQVAISIPLSRLTSDSLIPGGGAQVDIVALLSFKANNANLDVLPATAMPDGSRTVEIMLIHDSTVIFHSPVSQSSQADPSATITFAVSRDDSRLLAWLGVQSQVTFRLQKALSNVDAPMVTVPVNFSMSFVTADEHIQPGDRVDIVSICAFVPDVLGSNAAISKTDCSQVTNDKRALNVLVVGGEIVVNGKPPVTTNDSVSLAVPQDSLPMFAQMMDARMHFKLVKSGTVSQPTPTPEPLPSGKVAVDIPLTSITTVQQNANLQAGDYVDVIATLLTIDVGDKAPAEFQQLIVIQPQQAVGQMTQRVVHAALIVKAGDILTLAVSPDEAKVIQWLLSAKIALTLRPSLPSTTSGSNPAPTLQLHLESLSSWAADDLQVGDTVDVVMGFVIGVDPTFKLDFKSYGAASWGDKLSHGEITANIYAPSLDIAGSDAMFLRRVVQNATVIALKVNSDPESGRLSSVDLTLEIPNPMTSPTVESLKGYIQAGMPYLVVKH